MNYFFWGYVLGKMVRLDLGDVVLRRMQEKDIEAVKALIKVRLNTHRQLKTNLLTRL